MGQASIRRPGRKLRPASAALGAALALTLAAAGCGSGAKNNASSGGKPVNGGTAVFAEPPSTVPNYIFPFTGSSYISIINLNDFSQLMYRPMYWFGINGQPLLNQSLSLAYPPTFNGTKVTIRLKHYMWSNGQPVTAQNVLFWSHMMAAVPQDWGAFVPGGFPLNVTNINAVGPSELTMTMKQAYSPRWFTYNELSQITPMPTAWDRTASGPSNCTARVSDCAAVYKYLDAQSRKLGSYVGSPLWGIVDGPWKLSAFNADGHVTFVPNKSYSGPVKPRLAAFQEVPFTTDAAEYNVLQSPGTGSQKIDVGHLPEQDAPLPSRPGGVQAGRAAAGGGRVGALLPVLLPGRQAGAGHAHGKPGRDRGAWRPHRRRRARTRPRW